MCPEAMMLYPVLFGIAPYKRDRRPAEIECMALPVEDDLRPVRIKQLFGTINFPDKRSQFCGFIEARHKAYKLFGLHEWLIPLHIDNCIEIDLPLKQPGSFSTTVGSAFMLCTGKQCFPSKSFNSIINPLIIG